MDRWDIVTIGGGIAASALAKAMAERGARVLVVEREREFRDRVRGEALAPWGAAELAALGLLRDVQPAIAEELRTLRFFVAGTQVSERPFAATTLQGMNWFSFYHPDLQRICVDAAVRAGAEVRRGARVVGLRPGRPPVVSVEQDGRRDDVAARIVVAADGRGSAARGLAGFETRRDPERLLFAGVYVETLGLEPGHFYQFADPPHGRMGYVFPQRDGRARCYVGWNASSGAARLQGEAGFGRFKAEAEAIGIPHGAFATARMAGPLATFDGADSWVEHPYRDGVALLGDAAATSDPTWGQGMSMALRGARVLRDALAAGDDWEAAGHAYAAEHDRAYAIVHRADGWYADLFMEMSPEADERRARVFPLFVEDPTRVVDVPSSGPDSPCDERARRRFFGEE
ncbi:MAG TPA: NAD(P)/FAD-dependent oxidoreductase [Candidatus Eisenbacteria bacterium]|nr:NAD(P)/FAD-dependent oxidoreductase [Candidatus Eisenbacteria bacterium]